MQPSRHHRPLIPLAWLTGRPGETSKRAFRPRPSPSSCVATSAEGVTTWEIFPPAELL
jgi:hypothetical protein